MLDPVEVIDELSLDDIRRVLRKELLEDLSSDLITLDEILRLARGTDPRRWRRGGSAYHRKGPKPRLKMSPMISWT